MGTVIRIAGIIKESIVDGPGIRLVVFSQGCKHNCAGCHNPHTHAFDGGELIEIDTILNEMKENPLLDGITLSGGEPFEQAEALAELAEQVRKNGHNVMVYTGYIFEYLMENSHMISGYKRLLNCTDILVDGRFELSQRNLLLKFRGSKNQRIIDVKKSLLLNQLVEIEL